MDLKLFVADPIPGGYSWTLASRLGNMLQTAEAHFGPRDLSYTLLGIEFSQDGPQIWYPGNCRHIVIQLSLEPSGNLIQACYQLAHECIHLLSPSGGRGATVLEEGLATYFSRCYVKQQFGSDMHPGIPSYEAACTKVETLLNLDIDVIKKLRSEQPQISLISQEMLLRYCPTLSQEIAQALVEKINSDRHF